MPTHRFTAAAPLLSWISLSAKPANGCMQRTFIKSPLATKRHGQRQCDGTVTEAGFPQLVHNRSSSRPLTPIWGCGVLVSRLDGSRTVGLRHAHLTGGDPSLPFAVSFGQRQLFEVQGSLFALDVRQCSTLAANLSIPKAIIRDGTIPYSRLDIGGSAGCLFKSRSRHPTPPPT